MDVKLVDVYTFCEIVYILYNCITKERYLVV